MNIALISSEVVPFAKTGGLADVCGDLPLSFEHLGDKVSIFLPRYKGIDAKKFGLKKISDDVSLAKLGRDIDVYFVESRKYFDRDGLYGDGKADYPDNLERFRFFCWKTLELLKTLNIRADIVHCHDWQTALIPVYLKHVLDGDGFYQKMKTVLTVHNLAYQGVFPKEKFPLLKLEQKFFGQEGFEFYGKVNLLKGGIIFSDCVTTVSQQYAKEILTQEFGCGLEGVLRAHKGHVTGILNGLDYSRWDPTTDPLVALPFSPEHAEEKAANKKDLQQTAELPEKANVPLIGFVGRLAHQKGFDLVAEAIDDLAHLNVQFVFLGVGEEKYEHLLQKLSKKYPEKIAAFLTFDERIAHRIYAGSDLLLMPSWFEPCGLSQMIALRYGTIPVVYRTGGLADTILHYDAPNGNGFMFTHYSKKALEQVVKKAVEVYKDKEKFQHLVKHGNRLRFTWDHSAKEYQKVFKKCLQSA